MLNIMNRLYIVIIFTLIASTYSMARPPRPNSNFVWIPKHKIQMGIIIPGHWEYRGKPKKKYKKRGYKTKRYRKYKKRGFKGAK